MIELKDDTIQITDISPGLLLALIVADQVYTEFNYPTIVTSANDARHSATSLHYNNDAIDLRTRHLTPAHKHDIRNKIAARLNSDYDVILEEDHLHIEKQPKRRF